MLTCPICLNSYRKIDTQHLLKKHGLSKDEYFDLYPSGPFGACQDLKNTIGAKVKARPPMSADTRRKISEGNKGKSQGRKAGVYKMSDSTKEALSASLRAHYASNPRSAEVCAKLSNSLKARFKSTPKPSYDKSSTRYVAQIEHVKRLGANRKAANFVRLRKLIDGLEWCQFVEFNDNMITVRCEDCSSLVIRQIQTFKKHQWTSVICHVCYPPLAGISKLETELAEWLMSVDPGFARNVRGILPNNLELDVFNSELKLAVEFHGLYWHSTAADYDQDKHRAKYQLCKDRGIRLIQIFEDEWNQDKELVKSRLLSIVRGEQIDNSSESFCLDLRWYDVDDNHLTRSGFSLVSILPPKCWKTDFTERYECDHPSLTHTIHDAGYAVFSRELVEGAKVSCL